LPCRSSRRPQVGAAKQADDEGSNLVYTFGTSKGYVEKGNGLSLETLARLEKWTSVQKMQPKDCLISDVSSLYAGKLRGNVAILDQVPSNQQRTEETPITQQQELSNQSERTNIRISNEVVERFISKSEVGANKQLPIASKNFFKVGNCYQCKRRRFVFQSYVNFMPHSCQKTFCSECLEEHYGEDIYKIIQTRTHWSTPFRRKICKTPSAILSTDTTGCKPENQTEEEERVYVVDTYFKSQVKKTLELNHSLIKRLEIHRGSMTTEEKLLSLKIIHDNLETLMSLKACIIEHREPPFDAQDTSYLGVINSISRDLQAKANAEREASFGYEQFEEPESLEFKIDQSEAPSLGKRDITKLDRPDPIEGYEVELQGDELPSYRASKLRFDDHFE
jgi:hypothetical protein